MATTRMQVFKCEVCGNMVESLHGGPGTLTCCNQSMKHFAENTVDAAKEKHVPVVTRVDGGYQVLVGSVSHPMEDKHYIEWVELIAGDEIYRHYFKPGDKPEAFFSVTATDVVAREYCNLHGLWRA